MESPIMIPSPVVSTGSTPYTTAPSSPLRIPATFFYSAPTSPIHTLAFQQDDDFAFDFTGQIQSPASISAADELFHGGKIKPLLDTPKSPTSSLFKQPSSFCKKKDFDPFTEAFYQAPGEQTQYTDQNPPKRGRKTTTTARTIHKASRSSSFRISDILSEDENNQKNTLTWYNKWNLKNLLLFRSASEGSARRNKVPVINKYSRIRKGADADDDNGVKNCSFRSTESCSSVVGSSRRKVSAHEMHYTANRAVAEEMRRKTYLPYKSGLLGCLGFHNNGVTVHEISRGITSVMKQR